MGILDQDIFRRRIAEESARRQAQQYPIVHPQPPGSLPAPYLPPTPAALPGQAPVDIRQFSGPRGAAPREGAPFVPESPDMTPLKAVGNIAALLALGPLAPVLLGGMAMADPTNPSLSPTVRLAQAVGDALSPSDPAVGNASASARAFSPGTPDFGNISDFSGGFGGSAVGNVNDPGSGFNPGTVDFGSIRDFSGGSDTGNDRDRDRSPNDARGTPFRQGGHAAETLVPGKINAPFPATMHEGEYVIPKKVLDKLDPQLIQALEALRQQEYPGEHPPAVQGQGPVRRGLLG